MMFKKLVDVYEGERELGEVELTYGNGKDNQANAVVWKEIKISHYSQPSERCLPVAVLHTITANCGGGGGECFKMEAKFTQTPNSPLSVLHSTCLKDNKTAIMSLGDSELHLVAMRSKKFEGNFPCFWGFTVPIGLYDSCLIMLNLRCLGIVFDLDETLIVANTLRSFDDRIEALQRKVNTETDPQRVSGMLAEVKRYQEDRFILKQYADNDQVIDNGKVVKSQSEVVPAVYDTHQPIIRPLIRLQDKNIILTRINPQIRDTSVLVRLRPAWEDLRSYLTARGRKRFEVYVCTMAERDYALEMWRLLDPESNLINTKELLDRITCVKSGCKKSLFNVFHGKNCHPKMALVIDDRLKVWEESDQPRVHVVPAFAPYYAPQAEANNSVPVLCVARNVACNVRGGFFKDFDEGLLQRISEAAYEDDIKEIPSSPDVSNYLIQEDDPSALNGNKESIGFDGMADAEVERRLKEAISAAASSMALTVTNVDPRIAAALQYSSSTVQPTILQGGPVVAFPEVIIPEAKQIVPLETTTTTLHSSMEEGELPESEIDPDTRRRLLILQHGLDMRDLPPTEPKLPPVRPPPPPPQVQVERVGPTTHGWVVPLDEDTSPKQLPPSNRLPHPPFHSKVETERGFDNPRLPKEQHTRDDRLRLNQSLPTFQGEEASLARSSSGLQHGRVDQYFDSPGGALQDIAFKCGAKVEFKPALISSVELQFSMEVIFAGEKVGEGIGKTRRDAQRHASEGSLMNLADKYLSRMKPESGSVPGEWNRFHNQNDNGFLYEGNAFGYQRGLDPRVEASKKLMSGPVAALKELCNMEGLAMSFIIQPQPPINQGQRPEVFAQVEIDGQVLGKGAGFTTEDAKAQAAERAIGSLKNMLGHFPQKRQVSPRSSWQGMSNKRQKAAEYNNTTRVLQRMPSSGRFQKNASPVP